MGDGASGVAAEAVQWLGGRGVGGVDRQGLGQAAGEPALQGGGDGAALAVEQGPFHGREVEPRREVGAQDRAFGLSCGGDPVPADVHDRRAADAGVGQEHVAALALERAAGGGRERQLDGQGDAAEVGEPVPAWQQQGHERGPGVGDGVAEGLGEGVAAAVAAGPGQALATGGQNDAAGVQGAVRGGDREAVVGIGAGDIGDAVIGAQLHAGVAHRAEQRLEHGRGLVRDGEQLAGRLALEAHVQIGEERDGLLNGEGAQHAGDDVGRRAEEVGRFDEVVRDVAAPAAGDQDLGTDARRAVDRDDACRLRGVTYGAAGGDRGHHARGADADDRDVAGGAVHAAKMISVIRRRRGGAAVLDSGPRLGVTGCLRGGARRGRCRRRPCRP